MVITNTHAFLLVVISSLASAPFVSAGGHGHSQQQHLGARSGIHAGFNGNEERLFRGIGKDEHNDLFTADSHGSRPSLFSRLTGALHKQNRRAHRSDEPAEQWADTGMDCLVTPVQQPSGSTATNVATRASEVQSAKAAKPDRSAVRP